MDNCLKPFIKLLKLINVDYTTSFAEETILSHPDYPSMVAVSDALERYNIKNAAIEVEKERIDTLTLPCILQIDKSKGGSSTLFYILTEISENSVRCFNENNEKVQLSMEEFVQICTGISLSVNSDKNSGEPEYRAKKRQQALFKSLNILAGGSLLIWILSELKIISVVTPFSILYLGFIVAGLITSGFLLWYQTETYSPTLQKFCSGRTKMICESVINSKYGKISNSDISLSSLSFSYFFASFVLLLFSSFSSLAFEFLGGLSLLSESLTFLPIFSCFFIVSLISWNRLLPLLKDKKSIQLYKRKLGKIKTKPVALQGLLTRSIKIKNNLTGMGILFKSEQPKYHIKVYNPFCDPCVMSHRILESIYEKGIIDLQYYS